MPQHTHAALPILAAFAAAAAFASAPPRYSVTPLPPDGSRFERVDPMMSDIGPLRTSIRDLGADLRADTEFDTVFRVSDGPNGKLARMSGGLVAVFPRSQYVVTPKGRVFAEVSANTIYHIGQLPPEDPEPPPSPGILAAASQVSMRTDTAAPMRVAPGERSESAASRLAPGPTDPNAGHPPGMMTDEAYRRGRLRQLLDKAARP